MVHQTDERDVMYRVLLVEDEEKYIQSIQEDINRNSIPDIHYDVASDLDTAVGFLVQQRYELILLDPTLSETTANDTLESIEKYSNTAKIILLLLPHEDQKPQFKLNGKMYDYLVKEGVDELYKGRVIHCALKELEFERELQVCHEMETMGKLFGGVAHDLKNYFNIIYLFCDHFNMMAEENHPSQQYVDAIKNSTSRATNLLKNLLTRTKPQSNPGEIIPVDQVIQQLLPIIESQTSKRIELQIDLKLNKTYIKMNPTLLEHVLLNLVINAIDAMPTSGTLSIKTKLSTLSERQAFTKNVLHSGDYVCIEITDSGTGISPDHLHRIFEPLFTTKGDKNGTGYGLYNVRRIVRSHGGFIHVKSGEGKGSTFILYFPKAKASDFLDDDDNSLNQQIA